MWAAWAAATAILAADGAEPRAAPPRWSLPAWAERLRDPATWGFRKRPAGPSDAVLKLRCQDAVFVDRTLRGSGLEIAVAGGQATLAGAVPTAEDARRAERLVAAVRDLRGVRNQLRLATPFNAAGLASSDFPVGERPPEPLPQVVPARPTAPLGRGEPAPVQLSKPRRAGSLPLVAELAPVASFAFPPAPEALPTPPREAGVIVGRPISVLVSPDLPRVTEYTILRALPAAPALPFPSAAAARKRPGLVRAGSAAPNVDSLPALALPPDEIATALRDDPAAARLQYRREGAEVVLFGAATDAAALFGVVDRLGALPGVAAVSVDQPRTQIDRR